MPKKIKALLGLMLLSIVLSSAHALIKGKFSPLIGPLITMLLVFGLLGADESVRSILIFFGWLSVVYGGFAVLMLLIVMPLGLKQGVLQYVALLSTLGLAFLQSGFFVWCLKQTDVIHWMKQRSSAELQAAS